MKLPSSVRAALVITFIVLTYFGARSLFRAAPGEAETVAVAAAENLFTVVIQSVAAEQWRDEIKVRGRTQALRNVVVKAETAGAVVATPAILGAAVKKGDVLCRLEIDARKAMLREANAALAKASLDHNAAVRLAEGGFRSESGVASARAALDFASANAERATVELSKTAITAPFDGIFDNRAAEIGDFLNIGAPCGSVMQSTPFLVTGAVSEKDVAKISVGDRGRAVLSTGIVREGAVRFVANASDPQTRTFGVELEVDNEDGALRDGMTAEFTVFAQNREAYKVPRAALTLNDAGEIGVRHVTAGDLVAFAPVTLLGEAVGGVWVSGLDGTSDVIVRGQDFVASGQKVAIARAADIDGAGAAQAGDLRK